MLVIIRGALMMIVGTIIKAGSERMVTAKVDHDAVMIIHTVERTVLFNIMMMIPFNIFDNSKIGAITVHRSPFNIYCSRCLLMPGY